MGAKVNTYVSCRTGAQGASPDSVKSNLVPAMGAVGALSGSLLVSGMLSKISQYLYSKEHVVQFQSQSSTARQQRCNLTLVLSEAPVESQIGSLGYRSPEPMCINNTCYNSSPEHMKKGFESDHPSRSKPALHGALYGVLPSTLTILTPISSCADSPGGSSSELPKQTHPIALSSGSPSPPPSPTSSRSHFDYEDLSNLQDPEALFREELMFYNLHGYIYESSFTRELKYYNDLYDDEEEEEEEEGKFFNTSSIYGDEPPYGVDEASDRYSPYPSEGLDADDLLKDILEITSSVPSFYEIALSAYRSH
ncbi:hypothetical protein B0J17DRAFT_724032 [Rhizoctonia solani]|nr:hypothetical protein B0J17DRAFT_724032 [Rhizoctonia solani]